MMCQRMCHLQAVDSEADTVERAVQHVFQDIRLLESDMLRTLSEQTSAEKSTSKTAADIKGLRAAAIAEELRIAEVQNEIARVAVDVLNTQGHNERLQQALLMLDVELRDKVCVCCWVAGSAVPLLSCAYDDCNLITSLSGKLHNDAAVHMYDSQPPDYVEAAAASPLSLQALSCLSTRAQRTHDLAGTCISYLSVPSTKYIFFAALCQGGSYELGGCEMLFYQPSTATRPMGQLMHMQAHLSIWSYIAVLQSI